MVHHFRIRCLICYSKLGAKLRFKGCEPGDGGAFRSLKRPVRLTWLANNPLPTSVKYYSVVSFTNRERINSRCSVVMIC